MKNVFRLLLICFIALSCNSDNDGKRFKNFCSVNNPVVDLDWLKTEIEQREQNINEFSKYNYISQSIHNGEPVIIYADCCPTCNSVYVVFNCKGENIGFIGDDNFTIETLTSGEIIWKTNDFACTF